MDAGGKGNRREPKRFEAFTVVTAPPDEHYYGQWLKNQNVFKLYLPPWEFNEIELLIPFLSLKIFPLTIIQKYNNRNMS